MAKSIALDQLEKLLKSNKLIPADAAKLASVRDLHCVSDDFDLLATDTYFGINDKCVQFLPVLYHL
jgi:hypothetical protein